MCVCMSMGWLEQRFQNKATSHCYLKNVLEIFLFPNWIFWAKIHSFGTQESVSLKCTQFVLPAEQSSIREPGSREYIIRMLMLIFILILMANFQ